ncbi:MAG: HlyD family efflux transporter periplasmic adaptor subunit [Roseiflexaceae bacterium]|jgi:multidrug efflux pump subunit AcrA (membrane-fusion protein)|nr:efflux RND transporter periplasmic adaptor subunit [Chloroflexaceae bacterium]MCE2851313.1 efflux RND transporter periplasmic adaptor subunit [Chloroflexaceae bacterium]
MIIKPYQQHICVIMLVVAWVITACGTPQADIQATPTPIPEDPDFATLTYRVAQGTVERVVEETARVVPVESVTLGFGREGIVASVDVTSGDTVKQGQVLATLQQAEANEELRKASDTLDAAKADYVAAQKINAKQIETRRKVVENAREALNALLPGGDKDALAAAQLALDEAQRKVRITNEDSDISVDDAEYAITTANNALIDAQFAYSKAYWDLDWVNRYGTDPKEPFILVNNKYVANVLDAEGRRGYEKAFTSAQNDLRTAEKGVQTALRNVQRAKETRQTDVDAAAKTYQAALKERDKLLAGQDNSEIRSARATLESAEADLDEAMNNTLTSEKRTVDSAQRAYDKALASVAAGQIVAKFDGVVSVVAIVPGNTVVAYSQAIEIAKPDNVEFTASLTDETMQLLSEGQAVEIRLVTRPDIVLTGIIRRLPAPYGKNGGNMDDPDPSTRISVSDTQGFTLEAGETIGRVRIVLEQRNNVLWLPPEAIRSFGERRFVVLREGEQERRVTVVLGIESDERVEIIKGLQLDDVVVGP